MPAWSLLRFLNATVGALVPAASARLARNLMLRPRRARAVDDAVEGARRVWLGGGLSGLRWGTTGPVVLLLHGWEGRAAQFAPLAEALVATGRSAVALDAPAHGRSPAREATLMDFVRALGEAAAAIGPIEAVVGHSLGAAAAGLALARGLPARRAVLIAPPSSISASLHAFARAVALTPAAERRFVRLLENANGVPARLLDVSRSVGQLRVPALVVHDRADARVPFAEGAAIAAAWPRARLLATQGLGHTRLLAEPGVVRAVATFLSGAAAVPGARTG